MNPLSPTLRRLPAFGLSLVLLTTTVAELRAAIPIAWGDTSDGRCQVPAGLLDATAVAGGDAHSLALRANGQVVAWGANSFGQASVPANLSAVKTIAAGVKHSLALKSNGVVVVWGDHPQLPTSVTNVTGIAAGWTHSLALLSDGTVYSWGSQTDVPAGLSNVIAVAAGDDNSLALLANRTIVAWGSNTDEKSVVPSHATNIVGIAAGKDHCLALTGTGSVIAWGANTFGQTNVPPGLSDATGVSAGAGHSLALKKDGRFSAWGDNAFGQASTSSAPLALVSLAAGYYHNLAVRGDGSPVIINQPISQSVLLDHPATFFVAAGGIQPLTYQWYLNGTNKLRFATNAVLTFSSVQFSHAGSYTVTVANNLGSVTSDPAILTPVATPPYFTLLPENLEAVCGEDAVFVTAADGPKPIGYQWCFEGTPITNAIGTNLLLTAVNSNHIGFYTVIATNPFGGVTSPPVQLTLRIEPPLITSPLVVTGKQGAPFAYAMTAEHTPLSYSALGLPPGISIDPTTGIITGTPTESGSVTSVITAFNACSWDSQLLAIRILASAPVINSPLLAPATEALPFSYQITATEAPDSFNADGLPPGLTVNRVSGLISGVPVYAGDFFPVISASNMWGIGTAVLQVSVTNAVITNLTIADVTYKYSKPYLLDFEFSLISPPDTTNPNFGTAVVVEPRLLSVTAMEDGKAISPSETAVFVSRGSSKLLKAYLVLDFSESVASLANGDTNNDGISDAVETMVASAQQFVDQQAPDAQIGVIEFHRDDVAPQQVVPLTSDKRLLNNSIAGIWTNYVKGFPAASRCWDALTNGIISLGQTNRDEQHIVIFVSDGVDESSLATVRNVLTAATNNAVQVFCVGFGNELDVATLQLITSTTSGRYYTATDAADLATQFSQIAKDVRGRYILRWATLKRAARDFMPSFKITYQGFTADSPTNPITPGVTNVDDTVDPPITNVTPPVTNYIIGWYNPGSNAAPVTTGTLRLVPDAEILPTGISMRLTYAPRYVRQINLHYRPNWPCAVSLASTNLGELMHGWSLTQTNDTTNGFFLTLSSPFPVSSTNSLPFASFGKILSFTFNDVINPSNAFGLLEVDNTIYTNTGGQSFVFENAGSFTTNLPVLPYGTPVPWLAAYGFSPPFAAAELTDPDGDGVLTWQEYRAATDPRNKNSALKILELGADLFDRPTVTWPTSLNRLYRLEASTDLLTWETVQDGIVGSGLKVTITDLQFRLLTPALFYRVQVYPPAP